MNALCTRGVPGSSIFKALSAHSAPARLCSFVPQGPLGVLKKTSSAVRDPYGVCRAFTSQSSQREAFTSFGNKQVPVGEKEKLVGGVFTSVAEKYDLMNDLMSLGIHRIWKDHFAELVNFPPLQLQPTVAAAEGAPQATEAFTVLDLAGGTGDIAFRLADRALHQHKQQQQQQHQQPPQQGPQQTCYSCVELTVCDINADMLRVGMQRATERGFPARHLVDAMEPSSSDGSSKDILLPRPADFGRVGPLGIRWLKASGEALPFVDNSFDLITIAFGLRNFTSPAQGLRESFRVLKPGGRFLCLEFSKVDNPLLGPLYDVYSFTALPLLGSVVAGDREAYQYLAESIRRFPAQQELAEMMQLHGFRHVSYSNMTCGVVAIHSGFKA